MKVGFGADHAGFELKQHLMETARSLGHEPVDYGTYSADSVDYPDFAEPVARDTVAGEVDLGVVICSNGVGVSIVANKVPGARAALCHTSWGAARARQHTDANVMALGAWEIGRAIADECLTAFLSSSPEEGNHARRRDKLAKVERRGIGAARPK
ncbi:MAG: RpiB/LacA/LacB family sugar-phosphate isomerase [Dehalococcoidia bacterium]|nr:RpiB/LacA/LacB family sugar-phosphate isomerase [Dehalococcoidia bacterium]